MLALFSAFGAALALATQKLPVFAVSITAPLFGWIVIEACARRGFCAPPRWVALAGLFWLALFSSLAGNLIWGELGAVGGDQTALLVRYGFWLAVFVVTAALSAHAEWTPRLTGWLAAAALALVAMRLANEALGARLWLHQNEYGFRLSAFTPFLLAACLARGGLVSAAALAAAGSAILLNGSRSSWVALAIAGAALLGTRALAGRRVRGAALALALAPILLVGCAAFAPGAWTETVSRRVASFETLDTDKPFLMRLALLEKGRQLFERNPLFGAGLGSFDRQRVRLAGARAPWTNDASLNRRSSHNAYLSLLAETGLLGAVSFGVLLLALLAGGARAAYRLMRRGEPWAAGIWAAALAVSVHLTALSGLTGTLPWFVFGLTAGVIERERLEARP